jgi:hypothetical protein
MWPSKGMMVKMMITSREKISKKIELVTFENNKVSEHEYFHSYNYQDMTAFHKYMKEVSY